MCTFVIPGSHLPVKDVLSTYVEYVMLQPGAQIGSEHAVLKVAAASSSSTRGWECIVLCIGFVFLVDSVVCFDYCKKGGANS